MRGAAETQDIADVLADFREENGHTLGWVGDQIGVTRAQIHNIEARRTMASLQTFRDLARLMRLDPATIGLLVLAQENIGGTIQANRNTVWDTTSGYSKPRRKKRKGARSDG